MRLGKTTPIESVPADQWIHDPHTRWRVYIDIVGACNLRCPSCPVGNMNELMPKGSMPPELLDRIVAKAASEIDRMSVGLYNWTEPFLHPQLPEMIRIVNRHGVPCGLSSNLNLLRNIDDVMDANPDYLKVSVSGFKQESYGVTHARGDIELVKRNMALVAESKRRTGATTTLSVSWHRYLGNHEEERQMKAYADELGYNFDPAWAYLMPLDKMLAYAYPESSDVKLTAEDRELIARFALPIDEGLEVSRQVGEPRCKLRDQQMSITHEGNVLLCCGGYDQEKYVIAPYLDTPIDELQALKFGHGTCESCMKAGIHTFFTYGTSKLNDVALQNVARHYPETGLGTMGRKRPHGILGWPRKIRKKYNRLRAAARRA